MTKYNYSYYPLIFPDVKTTLKIQKVLLENKIISRRYFYPLINSLEYIKTEKNTPHSNKIGGKILCLPLHHYLKKSDQNKITKLILKAI
jgi:dTDP-4-amino-4,6-dideoxygalactose transaminase